MIALSLLFSKQPQQGSVALNSANKWVGGILDTQNTIREYFELRQINAGLLEKNTKLLGELALYKRGVDSVYIPLDSVQQEYAYFGAKIIRNSIHLNRNYFTLNKGSKDGIQEGMGVFNEEGAIGRIRSVSENYAVGFSILHTETKLSAVIASSGVLGSVSWDGQSAKQAKLDFVPRHVEVAVGDRILTSGFNTIFPPGIPVGRVSKVETASGNSNYLDITIDLEVNFSSLNYVYVVNHTNKEELNELHEAAQIDDAF
ncbi:rod shape-determining protein MreC [Nitritalea halalkaliphila LW7]|uniref:Cell shape-determining protein MreC n=1 Tax=Nitritalea halalkaliphila LW7 TaxID=1189621 RepID=I5C7S9_9BACT|nr:rod shape-determining protein MreC [Nitritalea halalkaliphila]EIM77881.1 rod shape-determining protein MreC [Nitritalea halalkaliphila LW7]